MAVGVLKIGPWAKVADVTGKGPEPDTRPSSRTGALTTCFHGLGAQVVDSS